MTHTSTSLSLHSFARWGVMLLSCALGCLLSLPSASADVPERLQHQGRLLDDEGAPATGTKSFEFAIYDAETGGAVLWEGEAQDVEVSESGFYSVTIGSGDNPIDAGVLEGGERWLQVTVDGTDLSPRTALEAVPYTALAGKAESVAEGAVDSSSLSDDIEVEWNEVTNTPDGLDDGDNDTLGGLNCQPGYIARYDGNGWGCAAFRQFTDQQCNSGQIARGLDPQGDLICVDDQDTQLSESEVDQLASSSGYVKQSNLSSYAQQSTLASVATSGNFSDLSNVPSGLSDGDDVDDQDADPNNEIQSITRNGDTLSLSDDNATVDLSAYKTNTDNQTLSDVLSQGNDANGNDISNVGTITASKLDMQGNAVEGASNVCDRSFSSCQEIDKAGCGDGSGTYQINPDGQGSMQVYCDMEGGWTFKYVDNGKATSNVNDANSCRDQGMMLFTPVSKPHYDAAVDYVQNTLNKTRSPKVLGPLGIYSPVPGEDASGPYNWDNTCQG